MTIDDIIARAHMDSISVEDHSKIRDLLYEAYELGKAIEVEAARISAGIADSKVH